MTVMTRRSFVTGTGGAALAVAGAVLAGRALPARADAAAVPLDATVAVGGATFSVPSSWAVAADAPDEDSVRLDVVDPTTGAAVGRMTFTVGSPAEASRSPYAASVFAGLAASESLPTDACSSAVWELERIDRDDVPAARCRCVRSWAGDAGPSGSAQLEIGYLYMALAPDWTLVYAEALASLASFEAVAALFDAVWASAAWPAAVAADQADAAVADFADQALRRGAARNAERPFYNGHWAVTDYYCPGAGFAGDGPQMPSNTYYTLATPEGVAATERDIVRRDIEFYDAPVVSVWCMSRTDSSGTDYLRSTVEVEGRGVVDVAFYEGLSSYAWYIAGDGTPVMPPDTAAGADPDGPWTVWSAWTGEPWQPVVGG